MAIKQKKEKNPTKEKKTTKLKGKGGGRLADASVTNEAEIDKMAKIAEEQENSELGIQGILNDKTKKKKKIIRKIKKMVDRTKTYVISEALTLLPEINFTKFDPTVELIVNTVDKGLRVNLQLPHSTGKEVRVAIANDELLKKLETGKIDFDVLVSAPEFMAKLAKYAKLLGPKGLMPNPKNNTISPDPEKLAATFKAGQVTLKTEAEAPIIHTVIGKLSQDKKLLEENCKAILTAITAPKIRSAYLKTTMSPSVKIALA